MLRLAEAFVTRPLLDVRFCKRAFNQTAQRHRQNSHGQEWPCYAFGAGGQMRMALFGPFGACVKFGTTEYPFSPSGEFATAGA